MGLLQDFRFAVRLLVKDRWFTLVAAVALALGIAANNAVFTLVNAVLIRGVPFKDGNRIVALGTPTRAIAIWASRFLISKTGADRPDPSRTSPCSASLP
jgi:hypothetical protein